jgi:hypothetical protein
MTDSAVEADFAAREDGIAVVNSAGTRASTAAEDSMEVRASAAVTGSTAVAGSMAEEASTAEVAAGFMAEVAAPTAEVAAPTVAAGPMGEATGNCYNMLHSHVNGWQRMLPAVFLFLFPTPDPNF